VGDAGYNHPPPLQPTPTPFYDWIDRKICERGGRGSDTEERHEADENIYNDNLCSRGKHIMLIMQIATCVQIKCLNGFEINPNIEL
jgi:hypothetical protein